MLDRIEATAERRDQATYTHELVIRGHRLVADEPRDEGGDDLGPTPQELLAASLASCIAITVEMYARRKEWDIGRIGVTVGYAPAERGATTRIDVELRLPSACTEEQRERLLVIAGKCPVHRLLEGDVTFDERVTIVESQGD